MKTWERVGYQEHCGQCGVLLTANMPILAIRIPGLAKPKFRCPECIGPPPPDLPERIEMNEDLDTKLTRIREVAEANTGRREWFPYRDGDDAA